MSFHTRKRLGGSQVLGGSKTFYEPGVWVSPIRTTYVNLSGRGTDGNTGNPGTAGSGNPANPGSAGNPGNSGNPGSTGTSNPGNPGNAASIGTSSGISITPSTSYPVIVNPGGFVTVSWNAQ